MSEDNVQIEISTAVLKKQMEMIIDHPFKALIADAIVESLTYSEMGIQNLMTAFVGYVRDLQAEGYKIGIEYDVGTGAFGTWAWDEATMEERQLILNKTIRAVIKDVCPYKERCIHVRYSYLKDNDPLVHTKEEWIKPTYIIIKKSV